MIIQVPAGSIRLDTLCEFVSLAHHLSFSTAAKELNMSQPALSKHISDLEKGLGVTLVSRGRKTCLTAAGKIFSDYALMMLHDFKEIVERCQLVESSSASEIRIQRPLLIDALSTQVIRFTREYFSKHEELSLKIAAIRELTADEAITRNLLDIGYYMAYGDPDEVISSLDEKGIGAFLALEEHYAVLASCDHPLMKKDRIDFEDIRNAPIQMTANHSFDYFTKSVQQMYAAHKGLARLRIQTVDNLMEFIVTPKRDGSIYLFPESMLSDAYINLRGDLASKVIADEECKVGLYIIYKKESHNPILNSLLDQMKSYLTHVFRTKDNEEHEREG